MDEIDYIPRQHLNDALDAYAAEEPNEGMTTWIADLVADAFGVARLRDPQFTFQDFGVALGMAAGYAADAEFK